MVDSNGLGEAFNDWQRGDIDSNLLGDVFSAWQTGEVVVGTSQSIDGDFGAEDFYEGQHSVNQQLGTGVDGGDALEIDVGEESVDEVTVVFNSSELPATINGSHRYILTTRLSRSTIPTSRTQMWPLQM
ncbi:hypothetical protein D8S78_19360 [Natrialba swarupiae]|nr:hypothetical protein [Natrialba swarupiae]